MSSRMPQRAVYLVTAALVAAMVGGFALASFTYSAQQNTQQGQQNVVISPISQLTYLSTSLENSLSSLAVASTSSSTPSSVGTTAATYCISAAACTAIDDSETIDFTVAANGGSSAYTFHLTISVDSGGVTTSTTTYYTEAASATASTLTLYYDLGSASPGVVTSVNIIGNSP
jgi:hypothetical protein